jgi:hypothetical protein
MNMFTRAEYTPAQAAAAELRAEAARRVASAVDYAQYTSVATGVPEYNATTVLAGLDQALGSRITRLLLQTDAESTLHIGAQVLAAHAEPDSKGKDLQANLMVNVVKEIASSEDKPVGMRPKSAEDLLRRCTLEPDFKRILKKELIDNNALNQTKLSQLDMA